MTTHDKDRNRPDLSEIEPLRPIEEVEQAARPGLSERERELEDRYARGETETDVTAATAITPTIPLTSAQGTTADTGPAGMSAAALTPGELADDRDDDLPDHERRR